MKDKRPRSGNSRLGKTIKRLREKIGLSQAQLADLTEFSQGYLCQIERGQVKNPSVTAFFRIAEALGVNPISLFKKAGLDATHTPSEQRRRSHETRKKNKGTERANGPKSDPTCWPSAGESRISLPTGTERGAKP